MAKIKKEKLDFYVVIAILAVIVLLFLSNNQKKKQPTYMMKVSGRAVEPLAGENIIEEKNIIGKAIKLDECLQDCQYMICKKNCIMEDLTIEPGCFRDCIDECNNKCLKVYKW